MSASPAAARSPHVVFEVDLTTDIRDRKLDVYGPDNDPFLGAERSISRLAGWREVVRRAAARGSCRNGYP